MPLAKSDLSLSAFDKQYLNEAVQVLAGVDEAGRGPLAGPVVASACILPPNTSFDGINDSKQLTPSKREYFYDVLTNHPDVHYSIASVDVETIDRINILQATIQAMLTAVNQLSKLPDLLLVDGMALPESAVKTEKVIKGDTLSQSIAAASILAKVFRDRRMQEYAKQYPGYGFEKHKGYGTRQHREAIQKLGPIDIHRRTFAGVLL